MTASDRFRHDDRVADDTIAADESAAQSIERTCRMVVDGRRAGRALAVWLRQSGLGEPDFQVLWCLRDVSGDGLDQTTLASRLAYSAAQVSATVEQLGSRGWISQHSRPGDRRRHLWQLSASGRSLLHSTLSHSVCLLNESPGTQCSMAASANRREAAA